jgi:hypothetical protein
MTREKEAEMKTKKAKDMDARSFGEETYVEAPANLDECMCDSERRLRVALAQERTRPGVFAPDYAGVKNARCATFGRCK